MKAQYSIAGMTSGVVVGTDLQQKPLPDSSLNMVTAVRTLSAVSSQQTSG